MSAVRSSFVFPANLSELLTRLNADPQADNELAIAAMRELLGSGIKSRCERVDGDIKRVTLTAHEKYADYSRELTKQCNGIVLECVDGAWKVLSMPSAGFAPCGRIDLSNYDIYDIRDGTVVTLYWYNDELCLSSANGHDVSGYCRVGEVTYLDALKEALGNINPDTLDRTKSYTLGFRNAKYHPLVDKNIPSVWLIQITDLSSGLPVRDDTDIGIPRQQPRSDVTFKMIKELSTNSVNNYLRTGDAHYGFILRNKTNANDVIMKSQLLRKLEILFYDNPKKKDHLLTPAGHEKYFALKAYLHYNDRALYVQLFPQFKHYHKDFATTFANLTSRVVFMLKSNKHKETISDSVVNPLDNVARVISSHIEESALINVADESCRKIIEDFIISPNYLDWYYKCL